MVLEYRERALARRMDKDGALVDEYTKKQKVTPVIDIVAVHNKIGGSQYKWLTAPFGTHVNLMRSPPPPPKKKMGQRHCQTVFSSVF